MFIFILNDLPNISIDKVDIIPLSVIQLTNYINFLIILKWLGLVYFIFILSRNSLWIELFGEQSVPMALVLFTKRINWRDNTIKSHEYSVDVQILYIILDHDKSGIEYCDLNQGFRLKLCMQSLSSSLSR